MPIRRSTTAPPLTLGDLTFNERFALLASWWRPGCRVGTGGTRFSTWAEYFAIYEQVRAEMAAGARRVPPFAEFARARFNAGTDPHDAVDEFQEALHAGRRAM